MVETFRLEISGSAERCSLHMDETLLKGALRHGIRIPHLCMTGECGSCRCRLLRGKVRLKRDIGQHVDADGLRRGYLLACQSVAQSDVQLAMPGLSEDPEAGRLVRTAGRIKSFTPLNHDIGLLTLELEQAIHYRAGQYAQLSVLGHPGLANAPRCYSFCTAPSADAPNEAAFHVRRVPGGEFTGWLFSTASAGDTIELAGALGDFGWRADGRAVVCVAGGSGLAPVKAMLEQLQAGETAPNVTLFLAARSQRDLYCIEQLQALQERWPSPGRLLILPVLSQEPADSGWSGLRGYCTEHLERFCTPAETSFYLCGAPAMIDATLEKLRGVAPPQHIHYDRFLDRSHIKKETQ